MTVQRGVPSEELEKKNFDSPKTQLEKGQS